MKNACEIKAMLIAEEMMREQARLKNAMEKFFKALPEIDEFVEKHLIEGKGRASLLIDAHGCSPKGFYYFAEKNYTSYPHARQSPYWSNKAISEDFPLDEYIKYLQEHCYHVEVVKRPFTAYSSTGKTSDTMEGLTMIISMEGA